MNSKAFYFVTERIKMERKGIEKLSFRNKIQGPVYFKRIFNCFIFLFSLLITKILPCFTLFLIFKNLYKNH